MQVHLIAVKIGIVRRGTRQIHAERRPGQHLDQMAHHAHLVQRRLPVEDNEVAVDHVPLDGVAALQVQVARLGVEAEVDAVAVVADDVLGARVVVGAAADQLVHAVDVEGGDELWEGHVLGDGARHADLVDGQVGVGCDDGARAKVDALAHQVAAHSALLAWKKRVYYR